MFTLADMLPFQKEFHVLYKNLKGEAVLATIEDQIRLKLTTDSLGHIKVSGHLMDQAGTGNRLTFTIDLDQTFLGHAISELDVAIADVKNKR